MRMRKKYGLQKVALGLVELNDEENLDDDLIIDIISIVQYDFILSKKVLSALIKFDRKNTAEKCFQEIRSNIIALMDNSYYSDEMVLRDQLELLESLMKKII